MEISNSIYGDMYPYLIETMDRLTCHIEAIREDMKRSNGMDPVEHVLGRIKSEESMREKCRRNDLPEDKDSALDKIHDAIGIRIVCAFIDDVYVMRDKILELEGIELFKEKDYIKHVKPNGYRSFHMIIRVDGKVYAEIQLRTISMDTWAALEHHMKYKKNIQGNNELIVRELKRCADELASTDESMQTLKDMINDL
ncbi:MAG: GTP pyrophosphokinase family protein [Lachnospiraceae bacterium]|nr:GTP pyrophosphokinase family protein [Lachnospiraceae bacterium]